MDKKYLKDFGLLLGLVVIVAIIARFMARGETLEEYDRNKKEKTEIETVANDTVIEESGTISENKVEINQESSKADVPENTASVSDRKETELSKDNSSDETLAKESDSNKKDTDIHVKNKDTESDAAISKDNASNATQTDSSSNTSSEASKNSEMIAYMDKFYYEPLSDEIIDRITGISYVENDNISLDELRYCSLLYNDFDNNTQIGEIICNEKIAQDIIEIFYELYTSGYQIESIKLIDEFNGDDTASMLANNTSCFNYRVVENTTRLSNHAYGLAIDINPFYNPYVTFGKDGSTHISPEGSEAYADRSASFPYKIDENDLAYKLFKQHGFKWGGDWNSVKDYQHFERPN